MNFTHLLKKIRPSEPIKELRWFDLLILTGILLGQAIHTSTMHFIASFSATEAMDASVSSFSASDNWWGLMNQGSLLLTALLYLFIRNFDFKQLRVKLHWNVLLLAPFVFLSAGLISDLTFTLFSFIPGITSGYNYLSYLPYYDWNIMTPVHHFLDMDISRFLYSLLNGTYEEFFFLGLLLSTNKKYRPWILIFSTIVRISFHTYQGLPSALVIGIPFGLWYYYLYTQKNDNLLVYFLGHSLADMVGTSFFALFVAM